MTRLTALVLLLTGLAACQSTGGDFQDSTIYQNRQIQNVAGR